MAGFTQLVKGRKKKIVKVKEDGRSKNGVRGVDGLYPKYELISAHTCRRSFASNYYGQMPTSAIMEITQHVSEKVFLSYINITPKENAEMFRMYRDRMQMK